MTSRADVAETCFHQLTAQLQTYEEQATARGRTLGAHAGRSNKEALAHADARAQERAVVAPMRR